MKQFLPYCLYLKTDLTKPIHKFRVLDNFVHYAENYLKLTDTDLKMSRDPRFLFEMPQHYLTQYGELV